MERWTEARFPASYRAPAHLRAGSRTQHLLKQASILSCTAIGLAVGLSRFIFVLREDLQSRPDSLTAVLLLAVIVGGVAFLVVLFSAAIGFLVGIGLQAAYVLIVERRLTRAHGSV